MADKEDFLFRSEAIAFRADRLSGDVIIAVPLAWQAVGYLLFGALFCILGFAFFSNYSRTETVPGTITSEGGIASIVPSRPGVITSVAVTDGQRVTTGQTLAAIRSEEDQANGESTGAQTYGAIFDQDISLGRQAAAALSAAEAQQEQIEAEKSGLRREIIEIEAQIAIQTSLVKSARDDLERAKAILSRGFISGRDMQAREETTLIRQQQLSQLVQALASKRALLLRADKNAVQFAADAMVQNSNIQASRAEIAQRAAIALGARAYAMKSPIMGRVTAITAKVGQVASPQSTLMLVMPENSNLVAELAVPTTAIGFIVPGQQVNLAVDAFPYERFGTIRGQVTTVARGAVQKSDKNGEIKSLYLVSVRILDKQITGQKIRHNLIPGMTLNARIVTEKQSLIRWLLRPITALQNR